MPEHRNTFAGNPLDREAARRRDEEWVGSQTRDMGTKFLPLRSLTFPMRQVDGGMRPGLVAIAGGRRH